MAMALASSSEGNYVCLAVAILGLTVCISH